ncbi:CYTH domain-containing protein [Halalkalibacter kiskunsagensis]|uniref:CYTH domain-containing protein n=1 Tax=Halalkalibacter kiskunsagensis TaxID=1548599 RepID=A0ABV6K8A4_9BACI
MSQEVEIEVKSMITEQSYHELLRAFRLVEEDAVLQHNHYFETPSFSLKEAGSGLRIREKSRTYTLTLKQPHKVGKLETHQTISEDIWIQAKETGKLPSGQVKAQLELLSIPVNELQFVGTLSTKRIEVEYEEGNLCFDQSSYFDQIDYEIEFEGKSEEHATNTLKNLLTTYQLDLIPTENKVRRFFNRKNSL